MDQETLVKEFRRFRTHLQAKNGPVALVLLVAPDQEATNSWNVIVSAKGLDEKSRGEAIREVSKALRQTLKPALWTSISRATVLRTDDAFIRAFRNNFPSLPSGSILQAVSVSGVDIPKAVVLETTKQAA